MKKIMGLLLVSTLWLSVSHVWACDYSSPVYSYQSQGKKLVYTRGHGGEKIPVIVLDGIDFKQLRMAPMVGAILETWRNNPKYHTNHDILHVNGRYYTDGTVILWNGSKVSNQENEPPVDVASFVQSGENPSYAMDKDSVYFQGKRTTLLDTKPRLALDKFTRKEAIYFSDGQHLYANGRYLGEDKGFELIKSKDFGFGCRASAKSLAKNQQFVFLDDVVLKGADAATFKIKRWMPEFAYLSYTDKNGEHIDKGRTENTQERPIVEQPEGSKLLLSIDRVFYEVDSEDAFYQQFKPIKEEASLHGVFKDNDNKRVLEAKDLDPEKTHELYPKVITQDDKTLYVLHNGAWRIIHATQYQQVFNGIMIEDKDHLYLFNHRKGFYATYDKNGSYHAINENFGRDEQFIYITRTGQRFASISPQTACLYHYGLLVTAEGTYSEEGHFNAGQKEICR